jgi:hypothetical protein
MRYVFAILVLLACVSCSKENASSRGQVLVSITLNGKTDERFVYNAGGKLERYEHFSFCTTTPMDEEVYHYNVNLLTSVSLTSRSMYSSTLAICNPDLGVKSTLHFDYDAQGRIEKVTGPNSYWQFAYNARGLVEKQVVDGNSQFTQLFEYDTRGNLVKQTDYAGTVITYQYDNKINPFYVMKLRPAFITPFYVSPNNVVSGGGGTGFTRQFEYNGAGLPLSVTESTNGLTYYFHYK